MVYEETQSGLKHRVIRAKLVQFRMNANRMTEMIVGVYKNHKNVFYCKLITSKPNETVSIRNRLLKLDAMAKAYQISKIQWPMSDKMFDFCNINEFKQCCADILKNVEIILIKRPPFIESKEARQKILQQFHNDKLIGGHCGQKRLYAKLRTEYYWPKMSKDIATFVKISHICREAKPTHKTKMELKLTETPLKPFDFIQIDTIEPTRRSINNFQYAVTLVDELSKFLVLIPVTDKSAKTVARAIFEKFILVYGSMKAITSDLGTEYVNEVIQELTQLLNIEHKKSTAYHHETVGTVERSHRILNEYIRSYLNGNLEEWDVYANYFCFCYNTTPNASTDYKYSPFELIHGWKANLPTAFMNGKIYPLYNVDNVVKGMRYRLQRAHLETRAIVDKIKMRNKTYYDKRINVVEFKIYLSIE